MPGLLCARLDGARAWHSFNNSAKIAQMNKIAIIHPVPRINAPSLGASIVTSICQEHGWNAHLHSRDTPISPTNIVGFSLYSPLLFPNVPYWLNQNHLPIYAADRNNHTPLVIAGGIACAAPGPIAPFLDAIVMGDAEASLPAMLNSYRSNRDQTLAAWSQIPSVYVPGYSTHPAVWTTTDQPRAIQVGNRILAARGCRYHCRFCQIPTLHNPYRPVPIEDLQPAILSFPNKRLALTAGAISHHPDILKLLNLFQQSNKRLSSVNICHQDITNDPQLAAQLATAGERRLWTGIEGTSERLRHAVGKPISDEALETFLHTALQQFGVITVYIIIGLPGERESDQDNMEAILQRTLTNRVKCWNNFPGKLQIVSTPFQALPHTPYQRAPAPPAHLITRWRDKMRQLLKLHSRLYIYEIKTPLTANITVSLFRFGPEIAPILNASGPARDKSTWDQYHAKRFTRLCNQHGLSLKLDRLTGPLPWSKYVQLPRPR